MATTDDRILQFKIGDRVWVTPPGDNPFTGTVTDIPPQRLEGALGVVVRSDDATYGRVWWGVDKVKKVDPTAVEVRVSDLELVREWLDRGRDTPFTSDGFNVESVLRRLVSCLPDPDAELVEKIAAVFAEGQGSHVDDFYREMARSAVEVVRREEGGT